MDPFVDRGTLPAVCLGVDLAKDYVVHLVVQNVEAVRAVVAYSCLVEVLADHVADHPCLDAVVDRLVD